VFHEDSPPKLVGEVETTLGEIFGSTNNGLRKELHDKKGKRGGDIIIKCEKVVQATNNILEFALQGFGLPTTTGFLCFGFGTSSFFRVYRVRMGDQLLIYES
jgi:hypothetical protein